MFQFTISDLGLFLNKSPVTIRAWERKGLMKLPRIGSTRSLTLDEVFAVSLIAHDLGRIDDDRRLLIKDALMALRAVEEENQK